MAANAAVLAVIDVGTGDGAILDALRHDALAALEERILPGYLIARRWYAAKDAGPPRVKVAEAVPFGAGDGRFLLTLLHAHLPGQAAQRYFLPLATVTNGSIDAGNPAVVGRLKRGDQEVLLIDAFAHDRFVTALVEGIRRGESPSGAGLRFRRTSALTKREARLDRNPTIRPLGAEQSNTSIAIGDAAILKGFRKLESGVHPEVEIGWFLTEKARFANTPALLGTVEWVDGAGNATALGVLQSWVPNRGDGWRFVLDQLTARVGEVNGGASLAIPGLLPWLRRLGQRTAEMHQAFAEDTDDPAFRPQPVDVRLVSSWTRSVRALAEQALTGLEATRQRLDPYLKAEVEDLLERRDELMERIATLAPEDLRAVATRLHGDFHLGQVLVAGDDAMILDFEGEPMRPLEDRRAKHCPLKDVAGMLRSFAYAAASAARTLPPDVPGWRRNAIIRALDGWAGDATAAFFNGYRAAIGNSRALPADPGHTVRLLRLFLLEKALYEVIYEQANRPDWLAIPVRGVLMLLDAPSMMAHDSEGHAAILPTVAPEAEVAETGPEMDEVKAMAEPEPEPTALDRLAERMGIEVDYVNAIGGTVRISDDVKRALLAAMGEPADDELAAKARLDTLEREELARPLPPVIVVRGERMPLLGPITLPKGSETVRWTIICEDDSEWRGEDVFTDLILVREAMLDGEAVEQRVLALDCHLPLGYHGLRIDSDSLSAETRVIVAPDRCWMPEGLGEEKRIWGISAQLYLLRSRCNWGIGDYTDLKRLVEVTAGLGGHVVGLNPLHAMFTDAPEHASPYSPASRLFLNILYIDVTAIPEFEHFVPKGGPMDDPAFMATLRSARESDLVDYAAVAKVKMPMLEALYQVFVEEGEPSRHAAFELFREEQGAALERLCLFQALRERMAAQDPAWADWRKWPPALQAPESAAVHRFAIERQDRIDFLAWTQWIADLQLAEAAEAARNQEMLIGLYRDLAVGADAAGAETWIKPRVVISGTHAGAPPDLFNPAGQDWGLPPFGPHALREEAYASFIELVRANMRHAGGLRIDHVMALQHLYWVPEGKRADEGAYVTYPLDDLVGILALESHRHQCLVVGEDLGTVPEGFRERMTQSGI
ncbi:MAG TPA: putative maltokinase, partial [Azospirillaceae bacterium]|nr:putative maltokinase [Azospirillaceae bacterium]